MKRKLMIIFLTFAALLMVTACGQTGGAKAMTKPIEKQNKILIAYFSATGNTEKVAKNLAEILGADIYKITPETPYTQADLNYGDSHSRSSQERDPKVRPAISNKVANMGQYDVVVLGYPIWWGEAPKIINTFLESYDFKGKTMIPFCTSGGSGLGQSGKKLADTLPGSTWKEGGQLSGSTSRSQLQDWLKTQGLSVK